MRPRYTIKAGHTGKPLVWNCPPIAGQEVELVPAAEVETVRVQLYAVALSLENSPLKDILLHVHDQLAEVLSACP